MEKLLKLDNGAVIDLKMVTNIGPVYGKPSRFRVHLVGGVAVELEASEVSPEEFVKRWEKALSNSTDEELLLG